MGKQMTLAQARARCHELGITPGRSIAECERRISDREKYETMPSGAPMPLAPSYRGVPIVEVPSLDMKAFMRRVRRTETIMGTMTGLHTVMHIMAPVGRQGW